LGGSGDGQDRVGWDRDWTEGERGSAGIDDADYVVCIVSDEDVSGDIDSDGKWVVEFGAKGRDVVDKACRAIADDGLDLSGQRDNFANHIVGESAMKCRPRNRRKPLEGH